MLLRPLASLMLALAATAAFAQASPAPLVLPENSSSPTVLPIWSNDSGKLEAVLLIESSGQPQSALDRLIGRRQTAAGAGLTIPLAHGRRLDTRLTLDANPTVGLLCEGRGVAASIGSLAEHCLLAELGSAHSASPLRLIRPGVRAEARLQGNDAQVTAQLGLRRFGVDSAMDMDLPGAAAPRPLLDPGLAFNPAEFEQRDIGVLGQIKVGTQGWVSIGGTLARARLIPAAQLPGGLPPQWSTGSLSLGGGVGQFGGEITGRVIEVPGQAGRFSSLGLGVTWRPSWRAQLSVGVENLVTRGKNPFGLPESAVDAEADDGRIPYVRYEQDL